MARAHRISCPRLWLLLVVVLVLTVPVRAAAADWLSLQTAHFTMIGDVGARDLKEVALRFEQFRETVTTLFPALADTDRTSPPVVVIVFRDQRSFEPFQPRFNGKAVRVGGYYLGGRDVNYITIANDGRGRDFEAVYHELTHLLVDRYIPDLPPWFDEGIAEFFSTFQVAGTNATIGEPRQDHWDRLRQSQMPLAEFFAVSHESQAYNEGQRRSQFYAQSWLLMHYARVGKPERFAQLMRFQDRVSDGAPTEDAFREAFGVGMDALQAELTQYARRRNMNYSRVTLGQKTTARVPGQPVRLSESAAQAWLGDLLMHAGRMAEASERLQSALEDSPDLPMAHASLGMLLLREKKPDEAMTHLERAIASDGANEFAYFNYGASIFERAAEHRPEPAEVQKAIGALTRAIEMRPGFTEAERILGYGYMLIGETEKGRAVLRRALDEEPGDERLALQLADAELRLGRFREARVLIGPIAARSPVPELKQRARDLLARSAVVQEQQTVRREAGLPAAAEQPRSVRSADVAAAPATGRTPPRGSPVFRDVQSGETRTYGVFTQVDCLPTEVVIHVRAAGPVMLTLSAARFDAVDFISYRREAPSRVTCGVQNPPKEVFVTWRPARGAGVRGTAVAVELLPEGYSPSQ